MKMFLIFYVLNDLIFRHSRKQAKKLSSELMYVAIKVSATFCQMAEHPDTVPAVMSMCTLL